VEAYIKEKYKSFAMVPKEYLDHDIGISISSLVKQDYISVDRYAKWVSDILGGKQVSDVIRVSAVKRKRPKLYEWRCGARVGATAVELAELMGVSVNTIRTYRHQHRELGGYPVEKCRI